MISEFINVFLFFQSAPVEYCGQSNVSEAYSSIEGSTPIKSKPRLELPSIEGSSLLVHKDGPHLLAYIGTSVADIFKVGAYCMFQSIYQ